MTTLPSRPTYAIDRIQDILRVPVEARQALFRDLEVALLTHELVQGAAAADVEIGEILWIDDGDSSVKVTGQDGGTMFSLEVIKGTGDALSQMRRERDDALARVAALESRQAE